MKKDTAHLNVVSEIKRELQMRRRVYRKFPDGTFQNLEEAKQFEKMQVALNVLEEMTPAEWLTITQRIARRIESEKSQGDLFGD